VVVEPPTLVVIDVQQAFDDPSWGVRNNQQAEGDIARLLKVWRAASWPIVHVRHANEGPTGRFRRGAGGF
jgi:nicotinamidase-related amidase